MLAPATFAVTFLPLVQRFPIGSRQKGFRQESRRHRPLSRAPLCIINPMLSMNFKRRALCFDPGGERLVWFRNPRRQNTLIAFWEVIPNFRIFAKQKPNVCVRYRHTTSLRSPVELIRMIPVGGENGGGKMTHEVFHIAVTRLSPPPPAGAPNKYRRQIRARFCFSLVLIPVQREESSSSISLV